jgi:phytoene synthase
MAGLESELLPLSSRIAIGYCPRDTRARFEVAMALDHRLSQLVARATEPILGQMRLAWWRDALRQPAPARPKGDAVLDRVSQDWTSDCEPLVAMVDGWEQLLAEPPLIDAAALAFAEGRAGAIVAACGYGATTDGPAAVAARTWALADLAAKVSNAEERAFLVAMGRAEAGKGARLDPRGRAIAVLGALACRALERGGRPLMEGRGAALVAARAAILLR